MPLPRVLSRVQHWEDAGVVWLIEVSTAGRISFFMWLVTRLVFVVGS